MNSPVVSRRRFLAGLLASPILLPAVKHFLPPVGGWPLSRYVYETKALGFTIEPSLVSDGIALVSRAHPMSAAAFRAALLPGMNKIWSEEYDKHSDEWEDIFRDDKQLTLFDELDPNSIEEIEIELQPAADAVRRLSLLSEKERVATADALRGFESDRERDSGILLPRIFGFGKGPAR